MEELERTLDVAHSSLEQDDLHTAYSIAYNTIEELFSVLGNEGSHDDRLASVPLFRHSLVIIDGVLSRSNRDTSVYIGFRNADTADGNI